jgi:hypothetical protein
MHILPSSPNQVDMMISSSGNFSHGSNGSISSSPDELNARLAMISFPETVPSPMPVTPEPPRMSGASKSFQSIPIIPDKSCKISCKKRKHSSCFRRVHFQQDPASRRVIRKTIYGRVNLTEEEKKALWWDKQPLRQSVRRSIRKFKSNEHCEGPSSEEFAQRYRRVLELCSSCTTVCMEELQFNLSDAPIRGLEQKIFPETVSARQEIIRKVVAAQHKLPSHLPPEQQSKLLRAASQNLTRGSRMLARLNGMGDATAAALERI